MYHQICVHISTLLNPYFRDVSMLKSKIAHCCRSDFNQNMYKLFFQLLTNASFVVKLLCGPLVGLCPNLRKCSQGKPCWRFIDLCSISGFVKFNNFSVIWIIIWWGTDIVIFIKWIWKNVKYLQQFCKYNYE